MSNVQDENADAEESELTSESDMPDNLGDLLAGEISEDDDANPTENELLTRNELMALSLDARLNVDIYKFSHAKALREIVRVGRLFGVEEGYIQDKLSVWLYGRREENPTSPNVGHSPDKIWRCVPASCEDWRQFAEIALRFVTISTSEADCERLLSRQRDIQGIRTSNIRAELLEALLRE